jgi:gustatory receptor
MSRSESIGEISIGKIDKILNPHQRQLWEDTKRVKEQIEQMESQRGIGSPRDLYVRRKEEKFNPDEMDARDSFYYTTKSLLVLFQLMGVMPIMRSPKGEFCVLKLFLKI